jgi:hypothetical protein
MENSITSRSLRLLFLFPSVLPNAIKHVDLLHLMTGSRRSYWAAGLHHDFWRIDLEVDFRPSANLGKICLCT